MRISRARVIAFLVVGLGAAVVIVGVCLIPRFVEKHYLRLLEQGDEKTRTLAVKGLRHVISPGSAPRLIEMIDRETSHWFPGPFRQVNLENVAEYAVFQPAGPLPESYLPLHHATISLVDAGPGAFDAVMNAFKNERRDSVRYQLAFVLARIACSCPSLSDAIKPLKADPDFLVSSIASMSNDERVPALPYVEEEPR